MSSLCRLAFSISFNLLASASASAVSLILLCDAFGSAKVDINLLLLIVGGVFDPDGVGNEGVCGLALVSILSKVLCSSAIVGVDNGGAKAAEPIVHTQNRRVDLCQVCM